MDKLFRILTKNIRHIFYLSCFLGFNGLFTTTGYAQVPFPNKQHLVSVFSDRQYYNFEYLNNQLYIGTDQGIIHFITPEIQPMYAENKKGYVYRENNGLYTNDKFNGAIATIHFNKLLPVEFQNKSVIGTNYKQYSLVISSGQLFVFKNVPRLLSDSLSIRSISKNYIGSYSGIYQANKKLNYPSFTTGYIREFPGETFICFDGLERITPTKSIRYESSLGTTIILNKDIGRIRDVFKTNETQYLLFSEEGLYLTDLNTYIKEISTTTNNVEPKLIKADYRDGVPIIVYYINDYTIYRYDISTKKISILLKLDPSFGKIMDAIVGTPTIFLLTSTHLIKYVSNPNKQDFDIDVIKDNLTGNHHLIELDRNILITSNNGLHNYNLDSRKWTGQIIKSEFNARAIYIDNKNLYLGTINGYYILDQKSIEQLILTKDEEDELIASNSKKLTQKESQILVYILAVICVLLLILCIYFVLNTKKEKKKAVTASDIIEYINDNIKNVTIENISQHFKITPVQLYEILGKQKPGEIIKEKRLEIIKKMRKDNRKEEDISFVTGFSLSYLKKIKT